MRCANCGKTGHMARDCRSQKRDASQRPCYLCGKPGHIKVNCPEAKKGPGGANLVETLAVVDFGCVYAGERWKMPRRPAKVAKHGLILGDFISTNTFEKHAKRDNDGDDDESEENNKEEVCERELDTRPPPPSATPRVSRRAKARNPVNKLMRLHETRCPCDDCETIMPTSMERCDEDNRCGLCTDCAYHEKDLMKNGDRATPTNMDVGVGGVLEIPFDELPSETPSAEDCQEEMSTTESMKRGVNSLNDMNVVEVVRPAGADLNMAEVPKYTTFNVVLDSGAGAHVMNTKDCKGYKVKESEMLKLGASFKAANGTAIKHHGQVELNILVQDSTGRKRPITSKLEAADVTKALWSVGLICDAGLNAQFDAKRAVILDANGVEVMVFHRANRGLYTAEVEIANPDHVDFRRQGA